MAYSEEQRPEAQLGNQNRNSLNIQQPGETDSYEAFFSDPNRWKDNSTSFSLGDVLPTMGKGFAQSVRGTGEMARGLGDAMIQSPVKTGARILNEFSRMGLPGVATVQDIFAGGSRGADEVIDTLPDGKNAVTDTVGKGLKATGKAVSDGAEATDEWLIGKMSPGAVRALNTPMTEGYDDSAVWVAKGVNLIGALVPDMVVGGVAKKVGDVTLRKMLTAGLEKKYIAAGMQPERATALAAEAVDKKMPDLFQAGLITHSTASAQGQSAMAAADAVLNADYSELAQSPKFQQTFLSIDADPQHAQLTDRQKMDLAKERVADEVRAQLATDPELLAVNAMAAKLGDAQLFNLVTRGTAKTVKSGIVRNATEQGAINAAQGGYSRYQENTALRETAGMDVSPWEGVADATIEGAAFGAAMGAPSGAVAGYRGRRQAAEETAMRDAETVQQDDAAPQPESVDPVAQQRESMQGMNREQLLEQYADADMATEGDASAAHRREAASQLLNELDEQAKRQAVMNELKAKPRSELLEEYRRLSQKEGRTETEEQQFQAIREVIRPQQEVTPEAQSQPENAEDGNGSIYPTVRFRDPNEVRIEINGNGASRPAERIEKVRPDNRYFTDEKSAMGSDVFRNAAATGLKPSVVKKGENQYAVEMDNPAFSEDVATETINTLADGERIADADPMEQPAFMRDPRFRGFTGDDTEVQARLARGNAPTAEELVRSQMAEGDAGPTAQELTERPRLPAPGDIHPGQGYPLPGEVARTPDENQAGRGGRFTTTGEVKGQSFQKGRAQAPENAAGRQGEILEGEPVRRGLPSPDEQNATAPVREGLPAPESQRGVDMPQPESLPRMVRDSLPELAQQAEARRQTGDRQTITDVPDTEVPVDKPSTHQQARGAKIEDFGEEIKGAAKHRYAQLAEAMGKTLEDGEYATQPLSKLFPKPDYARLEKEGVDSDTLAMMALYRSEIPTRTSRNMQKWISIVKSGREATAGMLEGKIPAAKLADMMDSKPGLRSMSDTWKLLRTLSALQIDKASGYRVRSGVYSFVGGKRYDPPQMMYSLRDSKGRDLFFSESRDELLKKAKAYFDEQGSRERETPATSADDRITFDVYRHKASGDIFIGYGKNRQKLKGGFESARDAHDYVRTHRDELVNQVKALREVSREEQRNATNRDRTGPERRKGDVSPEQFSDAFGFRGVQFGNYVESPRRQADLNRAYDSLHDLADVLNVPTKALSLNGRLGLAFGARGKGKAAAHYEPGEVAINLTKGNGPGALAHEWFHSLDNYFGRYDVSTDGKITSGGDYMTEAQRAGRVFKDGRYVDAEYPVRQEVYDAFKGVMKAINSSDMLRRSERLDGVRSKPYWSTDVEMAARAFERYVQDKARMAGVENDYLVNIRKADDHGQPDTYAYPTNAELDGGIREAFDHLFRTLKTRETDKGVAFYSRKGVTRTPEGNLISDVNRSAEAKGSPVSQVEAVARGVMSGIKDSDLKVRVVKSQKEAEALAGESFDGYGRVHAFYRPIDDSNNAYMAEELFHGKAENDLNVMKERYVQLLAKLLADYKIAQADLDEYLYARHAPERNAHIAKINPKMPDGGSGMTNAEAAEIMQRVRNSGKQAQYDRLAGIVDDMLARRRELIREAGLEESGVVDAWQNAYRYYIPLKGQDVDGMVSLPRTGKGFTIGGRESRQAMGRASRAQSPSTQAIQDLSESLIRHRKNEVGNAFLKLVQDNPDKDYWQVFTDDRPDTMRAIAERVDPETGETRREVVERPVPMAMMADRYFTTKKNGKTYYIKLHDPRLMRAMKSMGPETSNAFVRTLGKVNRFLATVNTSYNPEFLVSNFIRDVQTAVMNLKAEQGRSDGKLKGLDNLSALAVAKDSRSAMSAVYASLRGKTLTGKGAQWQKVWKEFVEDGGKTGWFNMGDLEGQQKEMDRLVSLAKGGWKGQSIGAWNSFLNLVEDANGAVENALRLSAYKHARDAGLSRQQAASLAKNMTVNFNRRGEQGALMNSLYMFANASIQGTANLVRTLGHLNGEGPLLERLRWKNLNVPQKIALAAVGAGYLLGSLNRSVAGEDDDGVNWYDKVPSHVKERNLVIMKSVFGGKAGEYWSIPLPYGYNVFFLLGHTAEGVAAGDLTASRAAGNVVGGVLGAFSPVGSETSETLSGALLKNAAPTILRPFANLAMNENFMGAQIYQENMPFGTPKPDSQLGRRSTPEAYKAFASWLNAFSGGSQYRPGAVDITPESLKFWIDYISGGTGRFISKTTDAAVKSLNGIDIPEQQVPFLGKISGEVMPYADQQKMYDRMTEVAQYHAELKSLTGAERTAFIDENNGKLSMNGLMQDTRKRLKDLRKQRDAIYADSTLSLAQQSAMVKSVERDMKVAVDRFNREYNKKVGVE
ncbi:LPD38 domain-containing protein [Escherichia coli]